MGSCNTTTNCNPCGPDFNAINQLASKAAVYARQANTYATDAANSAQDAENAWLEFNALYLGAFNSPPSVDNQGDPLQTGALYWNTALTQLFAWSGTAWVATNFNEFTPFLATGTTTARNLVTREADVTNVLDFGADPTGVADSTPAFSAAVFAAPAANNINGARSASIPRALICNIYVPAGTYKLSSLVNTYGKEVVWELNQAAILSIPNNLNGEVWRAAQRQSDEHHGSTDFACGMAFRNNTGLDTEAEVSGISNPSRLGSYASRDTVGLYVDNMSPAASFDSSSGTYTSKTVITSTIPSEDTVKKFRKGMIIDTKHSPQWSGIVESWNANGTEFTVTDWYRFGGGGLPSTPTNGTGFLVNAFTKVWAHNANVFLGALGHANQACGFELGVFNFKSTPPSPGANPKVWGYDCVNLGPFYCETAFIARGSFFHGFESIHQDIGFNSTTNGSSQTSFRSKGPGTVIRSVNSSDDLFFRVGSAGSETIMEFGNQSTSAASYIDFHSSGNGGTIDFDSRILASSGSASTGTGNLLIFAGELVTSVGGFRPLNDITTPFGAAGRRWTEIFAQNGAINTSDQNEKQQIRNISDTEKAVAIKLKSLFKAYKWNDAVEKKGENARIHFGVIAQEVKEAFESEGLDAGKYGMFCYDEWDSTEEIKDENGEVLVSGNNSGSRYGVRYDELFAFILANI